MIDLRSDTVTRPTQGMRDAMARAPVGDDVYGDDPTVNELEARTAEILGKDDAVFVPTGTMANQIALRTHTEPGDLVLVHRSAHIVINEVGGGAAISGVSMHGFDSVDGTFTSGEIEEALGRPHPFNPDTLGSPATLMCVENTHNAGGGTVWPLAQIQDVCSTARDRGLRCHLDGARLWHASAASGVAEKDFGESFDTVYVCFSKGLGAPVGSALVGSREIVRRARRFKQQFGGGWRQAGVVAAAALYALEHHRDNLIRDVHEAKRFATEIAGIEGVRVDPDSVASNIVRFRVVGDAGDVATRLHEAGVHMLPNGAHGLRAVIHRDVTDGDVTRAAEVLAACLT
ncbi:MAG: aminotransferase class I/II-fold pyridoxal phosphate-dependent enzyme [Gemmatimonadetes bacterium]|nr:aminotransferase class I/II-fold pyridoxal phosphate-dependent enzyme [Gemmatimonadota bacterium]